MKKINFKRGIGELIGVAITLPLVLALFGYMVNIFQISKCEQKLIYAAYFCGRSAAIAYDEEDAKRNISNTLDDINVDGSHIECDIQVNGSWLKGNFVVVTVHEYLNPVYGIGKGEHYRRIAIMIEHSKWIE